VSVVSPLVTERLEGCSAQTLDGYLRGLGLFFLAGEVEAAIRAWWDEDAVLWLATPQGATKLVEQLVDAVLEPSRGIPRVIRTPWRGKAAAGRTFAELRNEADDAELDWFDACALPRPGESPNDGRSDRENNPLLGQGGGFGRSELAKAQADALARLRRCAVKREQLYGSLWGALSGEPPSDACVRAVSLTNSVLGAYQSGRATGPGLSALDVEPTNQSFYVNAWDVVLSLEGLRCFRGAPTRRAEPGAVTQSSFPLLVRARPLALGRTGDTRTDDKDAFELLAPLWSAPCAPRTFRHLIAAARLRAPRGVARDTLEAALVQAGRTVQGLGFERLVRFTFVPASDPRYRYAVRRGSFRALGTRTARLALEEIVPFLRSLERRLSEEPPALALARRHLDNQLAALASDDPYGDGADRRAEPQRAQRVLVCLAKLQKPAARATAGLHPGKLGKRAHHDLQKPAARATAGLTAPRLSGSWRLLADDGSPEYRLAQALSCAYMAANSSVLREHLLPQNLDEGQFVLDPTRSTTDLERVSDPAATLTHLVLHALRVSDRLLEASYGSAAANLSDVALLLSGELGVEGERRLAMLACALSGINGQPTHTRSTTHEPALGSDIARLLLAASPAADSETASAIADRAAQLSAFVLSGNLAAARIAAERELRRRDLALLPGPPPSAPASVANQRLALALLIPLSPCARERLVAAVIRASTPEINPPGGDR
jgi:CRISPR-associated protein Csx17